MCTEKITVCCYSYKKLKSDINNYNFLCRIYIFSGKKNLILKLFLLNFRTFKICRLHQT